MIMPKNPVLLLSKSLFCPIRRGFMSWRFVLVADIYKAPHKKLTGKPKSERGWGLLFDFSWFLNFCDPRPSKFKANSEKPFLGLFMACLQDVLTFLVSQGKVTLGNCPHFGYSCGLSRILYMKEPSISAFNSLYYH